MIGYRLKNFIKQPGNVLKPVSREFELEGFVFKVKTDNTGTSTDTQFTVPTVSGGTYQCTVNWGDGSSPETFNAYDDSGWTHQYSIAGTYTVQITGTFKGLSFNNAGDEEKLLNISKWGPFNPNNETSVFYGCSNLTITALDIPDLTGVTSINQMFRGCTSITTIPRINEWLTGTITSIWNIFFGATNFNSDVSGWDVSGVTNFVNVFYECTSFNSDLSSWDVSGSTVGFQSMFAGCSAFSSDISNWDVSGAASFNNMMSNCTSFNSDISGWTTTAATNFNNLLSGATLFDQDLGSWDVTNVTAASNMLNGVTLSTANYNSLLDGWESQSVQNTVTFHGGNSTYSSANGAEGRFNLVNDHAWTITDGGSINEFTFDVKTDNAGTSTSTQFTMPTVSGGSYDCFVEWKSTEGSRITTYDDAAWTHEFTSSSTYTVSIYGTISGIKFNNGGDRLKFLLISQWGTFIPADQNSIFYGCSNLTITATDVFDLSTTTNLHGLFRDCSSITTIPSIESWDTSGLINIFNLFNGATNFNDDVSGWDISSATSLASMFKNASSFDQDLGSWDVTSITNASNMFNGVTLSTVNYSSILTGWEGQSVQNTVTFHGGSSLYSAGAAATARADLVADHTWTITDGGQA